MNRSASARTRRRAGRTTVGVLLALAVVATAGAPSVITVRPGDTLWSLARTHGTSVSALQALNRLPGNGTIYAGQSLTISGSTASGAAPSGGGASHRVAAGDTLSGIALRYGVSQSAISSANGLSGGRIYAGQTLLISGSSGSVRAASSAVSASSGGASHRVAAGETLSGIARRYGVSPSAVASANGLSGGRIYAGSTLRIPGGSGGAGGGSAAVPTTNAGVRIPERVRSSVAENRRVLAARSHPSKAQVRRMVADTARRLGVSPSLAVAVAYHESGFQQRVVSGVNAIGVMQVLPSTGRVLSQQSGSSLDLLDTQDNVTAGVLLLRQLIRSEGTADRALAGYYQGVGSIARKGILPQTRTYISNITALRGRFANG